LLLATALPKEPVMPKDRDPIWDPPEDLDAEPQERPYVARHSSNLPPPGWMLIARQPAEGCEPLLVPEHTGQALIAETRHRIEEARRQREALIASPQDPPATRATPADQAEPAKPASGASSSPRFNARLSGQIPVPSAAMLSPPTPAADGPWVRIWQPEPLLKLIERHNAGDGSADKVDRERNAAAWQAQIDAGPWRRAALPADPERALAELHAELGHLAPLCELVEERLLLAQQEGTPFTLPPILLVGPPGVGKSHAARQLAAILGLPFELVDMSTQQTNSRLHGSDKHWGNASPGLLRQLLIGGAVANPVVGLDELDKAARGDNNRYDPLAPLHAALEPVTACITEDQCIPGPFDASRVIWIATANRLSKIPESLLSRLRLIYCSPPGPRQALAIARRIARETTAPYSGFAPVGRDVITALADRTPRQMQQQLQAAVARAVKAGRRHLTLRDIGADDERAWPLH
jgi:ATP-dependent Lon protease